MLERPKQLKIVAVLVSLACLGLVLALGPPTPAGRYEDDGRLAAEGHVCREFSRGKIDFIIIQDQGDREPIATYYRTNGGWVFSAASGKNSSDTVVGRLKPYWWGIKVDNRAFYWRCISFWKHKRVPNLATSPAETNPPAQDTNLTSSAPTSLR